MVTGNKYKSKIYWISVQSLRRIQSRELKVKSKFISTYCKGSRDSLCMSRGTMGNFGEGLQCISVSCKYENAGVALLFFQNLENRKPIRKHVCSLKHELPSLLQRFCETF